MSIFGMVSGKSVVYNLTVFSKTSARHLTVTLNQCACFDGHLWFLGQIYVFIHF